MRAVVIGCNGYIGKHLAKFLHDKKWEVFGYDLNPAAVNVEMTKYSSFDLLKKEQMQTIIPDIDFIFYFAGLTGTIKAYEEYETYIDLNEKGILHILNWMRESNTKARLIFPSTRLVYKGEKNTMLKEDAPKEFKTIYALNKWFGEQMILQYHNYFGIDYNIFRICVPYGNLFPDNYSYGTIGFFLNKAIAKEDIILFGSGEQKRTFTHVEDICRQIFFAVLQAPSSINQIFNIDGEAYSLKEIAEKIAYQFNVKVKHKDWPEIDKKIESGDTIFDAGRIRTLLALPLKTTFDTWLESIARESYR